MTSKTSTIINPENSANGCGGEEEKLEDPRAYQLNDEFLSNILNNTGQSNENKGKTCNYSSYLQGLQWMTDRIKHNQPLFSNVTEGPSSFTHHINNVLTSSGMFPQNHDQNPQPHQDTNSEDYFNMSAYSGVVTKGTKTNMSTYYPQTLNETDSENFSMCLFNQRNDVQTKPPFSYITLIVSAMNSKVSKKITLSEIYAWITNNFAYYRKNTRRWQNSIRHALSFNDCFIKVPRPSGEAGKGSYWTIHPHAIDMFESGSSMRRNRKFIDENRLKSSIYPNPTSTYSRANENGYPDEESSMNYEGSFDTDPEEKGREIVKDKYGLEAEKQSEEYSFFQNSLDEKFAGRDQGSIEDASSHERSTSWDSKDTIELEHFVDTYRSKADHSSVLPRKRDHDYDELRPVANQENILNLFSPPIYPAMAQCNKSYDHLFETMHNNEFSDPHHHNQCQTFGYTQHYDNFYTASLNGQESGHPLTAYPAMFRDFTHKTIDAKYSNITEYMTNERLN